MIILHGHPESGHTYKVATSLAFPGIRALTDWQKPDRVPGKRA